MSSESVASWDFSSPGCLCASLIPWPDSKISLEEYIPQARASGTIQDSSLLNLLVEAHLERDPGNLSGVETRVSTQMAEGGAWSPGCGEHTDPLCTRKLWTGRRAGWGHPDKNQNESQAFLGGKVARQEAGTSKEGICKSVWGRTSPCGPTQCGYLPRLSATGQGQPHAAWRHLVPTRRLGWL